MENNKEENKKLINKELSERVFPIRSDKDLIEIRDFGRSMAAQIGFAGKDQTLIATALSEICRNVIEYAGSGEVTIKADRSVNPGGIIITVSDNGPGIENIKMALQEGYSTGKGLGIGLPGARRIMDKFEIDSEVGIGTTITMGKHLEDHGF